MRIINPLLMLRTQNNRQETAYVRIQYSRMLVNGNGRLITTRWFTFASNSPAMQCYLRLTNPPNYLPMMNAHWSVHTDRHQDDVCSGNNRGSYSLQHLFNSIAIALYSLVVWTQCLYKLLDSGSKEISIRRLNIGYIAHLSISEESR